MAEKAAQAALQAWRARLGADRVVAEPGALSRYAASASGDTRAIVGVLFAASTEEVQAIVQIANEFRVPLYPISTGKNWGLGSKLPVRDGAAIVDLSRMNRIHEVNVPLHYAVVEPGVTQGQLYDHLQQHDLPLRLNVTGSVRGASVIGNALERGVGYFGSRAHELFGLEVVLGDGRVIQTVPARMAGAVGANRDGIGPSLDGLFLQSNLGIVTRAHVNLIPRPEAQAVMVCPVRRDEDLPLLIDRLGELARRGILDTSVHVADAARSQITVAPRLFRVLTQRFGFSPEGARQAAASWLSAERWAAWSAVGGLMGTKRRLAEARREIRRALRPLGPVLFLNEPLVRTCKALARAAHFVPWVRRQEALLEAVEPFYRLALGEPTDEALHSVYWPVTGDLAPPGGNPDDSLCGLLYCLPMVPLEGRTAGEVVRLVRAVCARHGCRPFITLNVVGTTALECVINLAFDRSRPGEAARAHTCLRDLHEECLRRGFVPYRVGIGFMDAIVDPADSFWRTVRDLKRALDPNGILAPGRYNVV